MNAIVALCHFCEAHGPRAFFCTYSGCGTDVAAAVTPAQPCVACGSLGAETVIASRTDDGATYYSREAIPNTEITAMLRQAAVRSLTCESTWSADGGCVYFSEGASCHVLSCSFQLSDSRARGLRRWFSVLVLMKDRLQLLNLMPFFSEHMQSNANELKKLTAGVFDEEQRVCPQRSLRLNTGHNDFGPTRPLQQLTGEDNIFHKLHVAYAWMLHAGSRTYTETLYTSAQLLKRNDPPALRGSVFAEDACALKEGPALRDVRWLLGGEIFRIVLYCTLSGIELVIKSDEPVHSTIPLALMKLIPVSSTSVNLPPVRLARRTDGARPAAGTCVLEAGARVPGADDTFDCRWPGSLPSKCPTIMTKIESAMNNTKLTDDILDHHLKSLQLQWLGIANALKNAVHSSGSSESLTKLKQALGVTPHDELLVNYWIQTFCT